MSLIWNQDAHHYAIAPQSVLSRTKYNLRQIILVNCNSAITQPLFSF
jgi:hypothetical protein